jgi:hypothetical protein
MPGSQSQLLRQAIWLRAEQWESALYPTSRMAVHRSVPLLLAHFQSDAQRHDAKEAQ